MIKEGLKGLSYLSALAAGFSTSLTQVAGYHRASPSTTLDKSKLLFSFVY
jgi:hypothetical protein